MCCRIKPGNAFVGTDPKFARFILLDPVNRFIGQAVLFPVMGNDLTACRIQAVNTNIPADPYFPITVFMGTIHVLVIQGSGVALPVYKVGEGIRCRVVNVEAVTKKSNQNTAVPCFFYTTWYSNSKRSTIVRIM